MKQMKLDLANLQVDSFETLSSNPRTRGTVRAHEDTWDYGCTGTTCNETNNGPECTRGTDASGYWYCADNTIWQETCGNAFTCGHSCVMTGVNCHCAYTDGACTWGADDTCAGAEPACPV